MKEIKNLSKIKLFLSVVIIAAAMFIFIPNNVFATTGYEIYVNGEQFTSEKTTITCGDGTATFDISTNKLILNNATITNRYGYQYAVINSEISNLTIELIGNNVIDGNNGAYDGIGAAGGCNVVIIGDGNLTMKDVYYGTYIGYYEVPGGNLKIDNTTINIENAQATGIWVNHDLKIINSNIKINKTGDDPFFGIVSNIDGTITIDGGKLDINTYKHCILLGNGDTSNHNVVIKSGNIKLNSRQAYGIQFEPVLNTDTINGNIKIDGGKLEISTIAGGTNIDDSKITINSKVKFLKGTSLKDTGKILLNEAYTIIYNCNGGSSIESQIVLKNSATQQPTAPTKEGYTFAGWYSDSGLTQAFDFNTPISTDITLYAKWENIPATYYTVTFDSNGGSVITAQSIEAGQKAAKPDDPTKDGYDFKGWTLNGYAYDFNTAVNGNITLIATWEQHLTTYTLSFDSNGGAGSMAAVTGVSGDYVLPDCGFTAPNGKQFKAWSVGGVEKGVGDKITVNSDTNVKAVWEITTYTVSFDSNGGTGTMANATGIVGDYTLPANRFIAPAGKHFKCWSVGGIEKATGDTITVNANTTVTAIWENIPVTPNKPNMTKPSNTTQSGNVTEKVEETVTPTDTNVPDPEVEKYDILDGGESNWTQNSDGSLSIRGSGDFEKFVGVRVDENLVDSKHYTVMKGSTIVTLKPEYLNTLTVGKHIIEIVWTDGSADTTFTVDAKPVNTDTKSTQTEDSSSIVLWIVVLFVSGFGVVATAVYGKKRKSAK